MSYKGHAGPGRVGGRMGLAIVLAEPVGASSPVFLDALGIYAERFVKACDAVLAGEILFPALGVNA